MRQLPEMLRQRIESFTVEVSADGESCIIKPQTHPQMPVEWRADTLAVAELVTQLVDWLHKTHAKNRASVIKNEPS